jgi:hypothetical protein
MMADEFIRDDPRFRPPGANDVGGQAAERANAVAVARRIIATGEYGPVTPSDMALLARQLLRALGIA